jgi:uncharacterized membrane protein
VTSLIAADNVWALWAVILAGTGLSIWLEQTYRWGAWLSGPVISLTLAMLLSNARIMPMSAPTYDFIDTYLVPLAVALLLFKADVVQIVRNTKTMLVAFHAASLGTIIGAILSAVLLSKYVADIGPVTGTMTASYIGGAINFIAVKESFELSENLAGPLIVADNFIMAGSFIVMVYIAGNSWFRRRFRLREPGSVDPSINYAAQYWKRKEISLLDLAAALGIAVTMVALATLAKQQIEGRLPEGMVRTLLANRFVLITSIAVLNATLFGRYLRRINGTEEIGAYLLFVFLFTLGLPADLLAVIRNMPMLFVLCLIMAVCNIVVALVLGKLLRLPLEELVLSMNASLGGPTTAAAMAISKGWSRLVLPSLLAGLWGYIIGTPVGIFVGEYIRARW